MAGVTLGAITAIAVAYGFFESVSDGLRANWATLASGLLALIGAFVALNGVREQIAHQDQLAEQNRKADLAAARAMLPLAVTELRERCKDAIEVIVSIGKLKGPFDETRAALWRGSDVGSETLTVWRNCVRAADPLAAKWLALVPQLYSTSLQRSDDALWCKALLPIHSTPNKAALVADWLITLAVIERVSAYARGEADAFAEPITPSDLRLMPRSMDNLPENISIVRRELEARLQQAGGAFDLAALRRF